MMENDLFVQFKRQLFFGALFVIALSSASCQSAPHAHATVQPAGDSAELSASETRDGSAVKLRLHTDRALQAVSAKFEDLALALYPVDGGYEAIFGVPHSHAAGTTEVVVKIADQTIRLPLKIVDAKYPSEKLKVQARKVTPKKSDMARINREIAEVGKIYSRVTPKKYWDGPFALPIASDVTSVYGTKRMYNGKLQNFHSGLDLRASVGTPIMAPAPGEVVMAKDLFYTGNTVLLDHGYGVITLYAHMSKLKVKVGQIVKKGELLGLAGMTGRVTGPHLHWAAILQKVKVDPSDLTKVMK